MVAGMGLFGIGFGLAQNVTLTLMFERVPRTDFGRVSALWNLAYDAGMGLGATAVGLVAGHSAHSVASARRPRCCSPRSLRRGARSADPLN